MGPLLSAIAAISLAQGTIAHLPSRHYTSADGLAQDFVIRLALDPEGFLWIATSAGLSRFDGERFMTFGPQEGSRAAPSTT